MTSLAAVDPTIPPDDRVQVVAVTPDLAGRWLARNSKNRTVRENIVRRYAIDMESGDWRWTGETIKFDRNGSLLDGQHRLRAIVSAGVSVPMLVVLGLEPEAQEDIDQGISRNFADILKLRGESHSVMLAAVILRVHRWEDGQRRSAMLYGNASPARLLRTFDSHPELREVAAEADRLRKRCDLTGAVIGLTLWLFEDLDYEDSQFFFGRLADGQNLAKGDPIYELRRTLEAGVRDRKGERSQIYLLAITIKAWNAYRRGDPVGLLKWRQGGAKPEQFPEPI